MARVKGHYIGINQCECQWTDDKRYASKALQITVYKGDRWYRIEKNSRCQVH